MGRVKRHRWRKERSHAYRCVDCGLGKLHVPHSYAGEWFTVWTWLDGTSTDTTTSSRTPPCPGGVREPDTLGSR